MAWPAWPWEWADQSDTYQTGNIPAGLENRTRIAIKLRTMDPAQLAAEFFQPGPMRLPHKLAD